MVALMTFSRWWPWKSWSLNSESIMWISSLEQPEPPEDRNRVGRDERTGEHYNVTQNLTNWPPLPRRFLVVVSIPLPGDHPSNYVDHRALDCLPDHNNIGGL
ncbi:unnamed protein product, partial [Linum tenue]